MHPLSNFLCSLIPQAPRCPTEGENFGYRPTASLPDARRSPDSANSANLASWLKEKELGEGSSPPCVYFGRLGLGDRRRETGDRQLGGGEGGEKKGRRHRNPTMSDTLHASLCPGGMQIASCAGLNMKADERKERTRRRRRRRCGCRCSYGARRPHGGVCHFGRFVYRTNQEGILAKNIRGFFFGFFYTFFLLTLSLFGAESGRRVSSGSVLKYIIRLGRCPP